MNEEKVDATMQIVLAIVNIAICGSIILGVIALVFAIMSSNEENIQEAKSKLKIATTLNIVGIALSAVLVIIICLFVFFFVGLGVIFSL